MKGIGATVVLQDNVTTLLHPKHYGSNRSTEALLVVTRASKLYSPLALQWL